MANRQPARRALVCVATLGVVGLGATLSACSYDSAHPTSQPSSSPPPTTAMIMLDGHTHTISTGVSCTTTAAQPSATPAESGNETTRIEAKDDSASLSLSLSDETPPTVNSFALSLKAGTTDYQMPYQPIQSASQVQATKQGKGYTLAGTGQTITTGQSDMRQLQFGIHVTCP